MNLYEWNEGMEIMNEYCKSNVTSFLFFTIRYSFFLHGAQYFRVENCFIVGDESR